MYCKKVVVTSFRDTYGVRGGCTVEGCSFRYTYGGRGGCTVEGCSFRYTYGVRGGGRMPLICKVKWLQLQKLYGSVSTPT